MRYALPKLSFRPLLFLTTVAALLFFETTRAQEGAAPSLRIAGTEINLPSNGATFPDSFRQHAAGPSQWILQFQSLPEARSQ